MSDLRTAAQNILNGIETGAVKIETDQDETWANALRDLRAALAQDEHNKKVDAWGATLPAQPEGMVLVSREDADDAAYVLDAVADVYGTKFSSDERCLNGAAGIKAIVARLSEALKMDG